MRLLALRSLLLAEPATADFRLCNNTGGRVGIAVGYKENEGWTTEGWWNLAARSCETVLRGGLVARFYYIYALDYDRGGEWSGQAFMCTRDKEFTIRGTDDCLARGYDRTGFFEVDTGDQPSWTVQLTESADQVPMQPLQSRVPMLQTAARRRPPGHARASVAKPKLMRRLRRTKIVATLGPASSDRSMIASLFRAGADVFRINMSHTTHERMRELVAAIRAVEAEHGRPIGILVDLQGPKLRVGRFASGPATLIAGETFVLDANPAPGDATRVQLPHPEIFAAIEPGHTLLLDDGKLRLTAIEADKNRIVTRVEVGGRLSDRKGVSLPDTTDPDLGAGAEGPFRSRGRARRRHRLGGALVHPAAGGHRRGQEDHARPRRRDGEDREAAGGDPARRHHGPDRCADGGARRPRRRDAAAESARACRSR